MLLARARYVNAREAKCATCDVLTWITHSSYRPKRQLARRNHRRDADGGDRDGRAPYTGIVRSKAVKEGAIWCGSSECR